MAGDWIKVEKASASKPETLKIARMLGVSKREAFGLLVEFWCWLDDNCVDGVVDGVVDADVDALMSCPGLSSLLTLVGWVEFDKEKQCLRVVNFDRHNGETSKNRALKSERQAKWRAKSVDANVDATPSTREEKKRVITTRERVQIAAPTDKHRELATQHSVNCDEQWPIYLDWNRNAKVPHSDLSAGFSNWLRRAREFQRPVSGKPTLHDKRAATAAAMFGQRKETNAEPTDITAEVQRVA